VSAGLLSSSDLKDPEGRPLQYAATEESYTLKPLEHGKPAPGAVVPSPVAPLPAPRVSGRQAAVQRPGTRFTSGTRSGGPHDDHGQKFHVTW